MVNLKTGSGTVASVAAENINMKLPLKFAQIRNMRTHCIPKCHDVLIEWSLFVNRCLVNPYILSSRTMPVWLSLPVLVRRGESKRSRNVVEFESLTRDAQ